MNYLLFLVLVVVPGARAQFLTESLQCSQSTGTGLSSPATCNPAANVGDLVVINFNFQPTATATASISDSQGNTWHQPAAGHCGGGAANKIQNDLFYTTVTNNSSGIINTTIPWTGGGTAAYRVYAWVFSGVSRLTLDALDQATCQTFNSNSATQTISSITLADHDAVVSSIVCASPNTGTTEFAPVSPLVSGTGENGGANSSYRGAHVIDLGAGGSFAFQFTSAQGCTFGTTEGTKFAAGFLSSSRVSNNQYGRVPVIQSAGNSTNAASISCTFNKNVSSGNILIVGFEYFNSTGAITVSDTRSTSFTQNKNDNTGGAGSVNVGVYSGTLGSGGVDTITVAIVGASFMDVSCVELPPLFSTTVDASNINTFSGSPSVVNGTVTTTLNSDFIFCYYGGFQNNGNFSQIDQYYLNGTAGADSGAAVLLIGGTAGAETCAVTNAANTVGRIAVVAYSSNGLTVRSPAALPQGATTTAYNYKLLATGGAGVYTWTISAGSLPSGLSLNASTGEITGTPAASSNYSFTVQVADTAAHTATKAVTMSIANGMNTISVVQTKVGHNTTLSFTSNITSGNLIVIVTGYYTSVVSTVSQAGVNYCTDTLGTPFQLIQLSSIMTDRLSSASLQIFAGIAPSGGADLVDCAGWSGMGIIFEVANAQYFGDEQTNQRITTLAGSPISSAALTTKVANELLISWGWGYSAASTTVLQSPFTSLDGTHPEDGGYQVVTTATDYQSSSTISSNASNIWGIALAAFRPGNNGTIGTAGKRRNQIM